ncbi:DNA transposase THAP9 isoform X2 [Scomber scombrus]|uniref:DNA transposase THAP9 isoform X2 n=1 Tax=Scomber scombrus TaxID=13677 RepID=A0AAV1PKH0_SCOSC
MNSLSPETQRVLLSHALEELHARGIRVVCVTMDGHASNVRMCKQLGCELKGNPREPLKTSFPHLVTGEKVFVMMDAYHMLKLAPNMLQVNDDRCRPIAGVQSNCTTVQLDCTPTGQINWSYKHVYFVNHKIRVSLAAQTLSRSVSVALRTMRDLGYSQFKDCKATAEFM